MKHGPRGPKCNTHFFYKLTCADYDRLAARAAGHCEICGIADEDTPHGFLNIDHDSRRGQGAVRGLLCARCNTLLGRPGLTPPDVLANWLNAPLFKEDGPPLTRRKRQRRECPACGRDCAVRVVDDQLYPHSCVPMRLAG